jgi:murein DD-endopeptidase MepM/ murein hydrolase activator NlpD
MNLPVKKIHKITSDYGKRVLNGVKEFHDGMDFVSKTDQSVLAIADGVVIYDMDNYNDALRWVDAHHSAGNMVIIQHIINDVKYFVRYLHLRNNVVKVGDQVVSGQYIGEYADVGRSFGPHLHLDAWTEKWQKINPHLIMDEIL